jgi:nucleotide-binding universal stress UspA family protein
MRILVAVDGSPFSDTAVAEVARRPWPAGSEVMIVTAFEAPVAAAPDIWALPAEYFDQVERSVRMRADAVMQTATARLKQALGPEINVTGKIVSGPPRRVILDEAEKWPADLIVVGSHGYPPWERLLLGSVSQAVVSQAKCSVEVVRGRSTENPVSN